MREDPKSPHVGAVYQLDHAPLSHHDGVLRADDYGDVYFSADNGLAESRYVFIEGTGLAERLSHSAHLTIAETGFGTGLNFLAVLALLEKYPQCQVDFISCESRPLAPDIISKAHAAFPALAALTAALVKNLPPRWPGVHLRHFLDGRVRLHLYYGDAEAHLSEADFLADIWFLDGFAPSKNPDMWRQSLLGHIGRLTRAGGRLASFTAATAVRDRLSDAGFAISKRPGFGRKREMITGVKPGSPAPYNAGQKVGIIGGGIAGTAVAAGLRHRGIDATILDASSGLARAASGNRMALQTPRLTVDHNESSQLSAACLSYAAVVSDLAGATIADHVLSLDWPGREASRQNKFRQQFWPDDLVRPLDQSGLPDYAGIPLAVAGIGHDYGRVIDPARLCVFLAAGTQQIFNAEIADILRSDKVFTLVTKDGRRFEFDKIVLATGAGLTETLTRLAIDGVRLDITAGQVSHVPALADLDGLRAGLSFGGYLTPAHNGFHELGATFDRTGQTDFDANAFHHNRDLLPPDLKALLAHLDDCPGRRSQRASTPDRNPVIGRLEDGIYVLGAVGARGFTLAPLLGDYLAADIAAMPNCLGRRLRAALDPFRFRLRRSL